MFACFSLLCGCAAIDACGFEYPNASESKANRRNFLVTIFSVEECKKRWRSLRDAFMKQYKLFQRGDTSVKKKWLFYEQMVFLGPYIDA